MKKRALLVALLLALGACQPTQDDREPPPPKPQPKPAPVEWLREDVTCTGAITRAQWMLCDNAELRQLHRRLAVEWEAGRSYAAPEQLRVQRAQLGALIAERDSCQDAKCVAAAYRRYLSAPLPAPAPTTRPKPKPKPKAKAKPRPHRARYDGRPPESWRDDDGELSCVADMGLSGAQRMAAQCAEVNPGSGPSCTIRRSCTRLKQRIVRGCDATYRKPRFCPGV